MQKLQVTLFVTVTDYKVFIAKDMMMREAILELQIQLSGRLYRPTDPGYAEAHAPWSLTFESRPELVVEPRTPQDIQKAISFASAHQMAVAVQSTGHGSVKPRIGGMLINTHLMRAVAIDSQQQTATVEPGALWSDVFEAIGDRPLVPITGTSPWVGVMGFTLGGGHGWLSREYGLAADSIIGATVVLASGEVVVADASQNSELLWGLKGGSGNFGIVTSLTYRLHQSSAVFAGSCYFDVSHALEVMKAFTSWVPHLPNNCTASILHLTMPPIEQLPDNLRGRKVIALQMVCNNSPQQGQELLRVFLQQLEGILPLQNYIQPTTYAAFMMQAPLLPPTASLDVTAMQQDLLLEELKILAAEMQQTESPTPIIEIRYWGGELGHPTGSSPLDYSNIRFSVYATLATGLHDAKTEQSAVTRFKALSQQIKKYGTDKTFLNFISDTTITDKAFDQKTYARLARLKHVLDTYDMFTTNHTIILPKLMNESASNDT